MTITDDTGGIRCQSIETTRQQMDGKAADWRRAHASEPKLTFEAACVRRLTRQWRGRALSDKRHIPWFPEWRGCFGCEQHRGECCNGGGDCVLGICRCKDSTAAAMDCAPPRDVPPAGSDRRTLGIYVYDLPERFGMAGLALKSWLIGGGKIYSAEWRFADQLLRDRRVRVTDAASADLFYVPLFSTYSGSNYGCDRSKVALALDFVSKTAPFYNASGGYDHVLFLTGDRGGCGLGAVGNRAIVVSHFGLLAPFNRMGSVALESPARSLGDVSSITDDLRAGRWCYAPHKDIVVPPFVEDEPLMSPTGAGIRTGGLGAVGAMQSPRRWRYDLLHAGGIYGWKQSTSTRMRGSRTPLQYSQGMRQALYEEFTAAPPAGVRKLRIAILNHSVADDEFRYHARTCLAPNGFGWGMRLTLPIAQALELNSTPSL